MRIFTGQCQDVVTKQRLSPEIAPGVTQCLEELRSVTQCLEDLSSVPQRPLIGHNYQELSSDWLGQI